jgi:hypothetical protein
MRKIVLPTLLALLFSMVMVLASPIPVIAQSSSTTTVYFDPPAINCTVVGQDFTVNVNVRDADEISGWQVGLIFDPTVLGCTGFFEGEFLSDAGTTKWSKGTINNVTGVITFHACSLYGSVTASGDGRLAYVNFTVIAPGVSDLHLRDVKVLKIDEWGMVFEVATNIIDVYTVVEATPPQTVVIVSNSTGSTGQYNSGFYDHSFNLTLKEISFIVSGPKPGFSNITIPKSLLNTSNLDNWIVIIDNLPLSTQERTATQNATQTFLYFSYSLGIHEVQITTRTLVSSTVSIDLSSTTVALGNNVTISGTIDPVRENATVTIRYRVNGGEWATLVNVTTDVNSDYAYVWTPDAAGTYEVKASWTGDSVTLGAESNVLSLTVLKMSSTISINLSSTTVALGNNVTISGAIDPWKPAAVVTVRYRLSGGDWAVLAMSETDQNSMYSYTLTVEELGLHINEAGTYEVKASWTGDSVTLGAESNVLSLTVLKMSSTISINLSSTTVALGNNVTISGAIDPWKPAAVVTVRYRLSGGDWATLANVTTDSNSDYAYVWTPDAAGTYEVKASWTGDKSIEGDESEPPYPTLTVEEAPPPDGIDPYVVAAVVVAVIIIAAIAIYFVKFRKSG